MKMSLPVQSWSSGEARAMTMGPGDNAGTLPEHLWLTCQGQGPEQLMPVLYRNARSGVASVCRDLEMESGLQEKGPQQICHMWCKVSF